jgi:hypothetical protein
MTKVRFNLRSYKKEITVKDGFDTVPEAIEDALRHCEALCDSEEKDIAEFETREQGLEELKKLVNTYCHYQHFSRNRYEILLHTLEEEYYDEDFEEWCTTGWYDTVSNWKER